MDTTLEGEEVVTTGCVESTESDETIVNQMVEQTVNPKSVKALKTAIEFITNSLDSKQNFFQLKDFYHYFCVVNEIAIDKQYLQSVAPQLNSFYKKTIQVCYEWKCLSDNFENDFRLFNCIQKILKSIIDQMNDNFMDNNVVNQCIPLLLISMIVIVSTIHGLKEVLVITRPIIKEIVLQRQRKGLPINSNEWIQLTTYAMICFNIWKQINESDPTDEHNFPKFVVRLVDLSLGKDQFLSHISSKSIKCLSNEKNILLDQLFIEYQTDISSHILQLLRIESFDNLGILLHKTMSLFGVNCLPRELLRHIVPHFALECNHKSKLFIEEIAKIDDKSSSDVIKIYLNDIIRIMFYSTNSSQKSCSDLMEEIRQLSSFSNNDIKYRIKIVSYDLINSLLMFWSKDFNSTLRAITFVQYIRNEEESKTDLNYFFANQSELRNILKEYFLAFVHKFDSVMQDYSVCNREKISATESFVQLIDFMGNQCINTFRVKIFSTIKLILSERFYPNMGLIKLSIEAMMRFIKMIDESYLSSQLLTISALMLPLMHLWPKETSTVFKQLIIENKSKPLFQSSFKHLYFIPEIKELIEVTEVLKPYITYSDKEDDIYLNLILVVNNINHENCRVQEFSLRELKKLLTRRQTLIYKKCNNIKEFISNDFVNQIVTQLMLCLKSSNEEVLLLVAECLGILGAIDPLRVDLDKPIISKEENSEKFLNANDKGFKILLITLLYKAITTATKTDDQYSASYALQEIIKHFTNVGFSLDELPQELRDYCAVLQKTKYSPTKSLYYSDVTTAPIFDSIPNLTYKEWLNRWLTTLFQSFIFNRGNQTNEMSPLLSQSSSGTLPSQRSQQFEEELAQSLANYSINSQVLNVCFYALLRNQSVAQFLLPYIVIIALKNAKLEEKQFILTEVKTIITKLTTDDSIFEREIGHLSSQTVFHIYDYLKIWHKNRISLHNKVCATPRHLKAAQIKDKEFKGVKYFLDNISAKELSVLAFKCNAFSRSLRYLEDYVNLKGNTFQEEIALFQKIFIRLDEPDSVEGCNTKRIRSPNISERILTHEAMNQIQEALVCCAKAVELNPNDFECHEKYLKTSMDSFDQSELVYTYGTGLMVRRPDWRRKLAPYVIEAVWKLGNWEQLDTQLAQHQNNCLPSIGAGIGELFCSIIKKKEMNEFDEKIKNLRRILVGPLSAAAMEISGYVRGHKYIVDLHTLYDIQLMYEKVITELDEEIYSIDSLETKFSKVIEVWDQRNDLIRKTIKCQEPILNAQRALLTIFENRSNCSQISNRIKKELFKSWLLSTKTSRKSGNIQRSYNCLLEMNKMRELLNLNFGDSDDLMSVSPLTAIESSEAIIETAKVNWNKNNKIGAIQYIKNEIHQNYSDYFEMCYKKAVNNLGQSWSSDEILGIRNSLSFGCASNRLNQSSGYLSLNSSPNSSCDDSPDEAFAKLQLLYTKYCDESGVLDQNTLAVLYKSVTIASPNWEESHYNLGMYCYKIYTNYEDSKKNSKSYSMGKPEEILQMKGKVIQSLVESLKYGVKHSHNSLPLLLNIWFDLGTEHSLVNKKNTISSQQFSEEIRKTIERINSGIRNLLANSPIFIFFVSFAQLTARVLHPIQSICGILRDILSRLIAEFPQQSMWLLIRSMNSYNIHRKHCFTDILNKAMKLDQKGYLQKFIPKITKFSKIMQDMCQRNPDSGVFGRNRGPKVKQMSVRKDFPELDKMFSSDDKSEILLPFSSLISVTLPKSMHENNFNPFPQKQIFIHNFDDCIELLHSLQRPKKIKINGSDGKAYTILCKNVDDLRKDYCLIEFCNLLNRCFKRDSEARRRQLKVKTYLVIPLTDNCGLIEWIPGLLPIRTIIETQYRILPDFQNYDRIKDNVIRNYSPNTVPKHERVRRFQHEILPQFQPSVFGNWFLSTYTDPLSWFSARLSYIRSSAVFSIVGYLLGLGDRHGENILIEELSGESVHVDLNCMFNKGEEFQYPEKVPFRLTHNMVNAMGVQEFEGTFRKACEHTLRVARDNKEALMNFINPFRYDHLLEWLPKESQSKSTSIESQIECGERIVFNIEARLNGIPSRTDKNLPKGISLSVEGQVDHIIKEATDINNLGVMYVGWTPYL